MGVHPAIAPIREGARTKYNSVPDRIAFSTLPCTCCRLMKILKLSKRTSSSSTYDQLYRQTDFQSKRSPPQFPALKYIFSSWCYGGATDGVSWVHFLTLLRIP